MEAHHATIWEAIADAIPDADALVQGDVRRTWGQFEDRAARLAGAFTAAGLGPGSKVAEFLFNSPEYLEAYFAALKVRCVPVNVNYRYVDEELWYLLDNAEAEALVYHSSLRHRVAAVRDRLPNLRLVVEVDDGGGHLDGTERYEELVAATEPAPRIERDPHDGSMVYTGGTTGMPKGVTAEIGEAVEGLFASAPPLLGEAPVSSPEEAVALAVRRVGDGRQFASIPAPPLMHQTALGIGVLPALLFGARIVLLNGRKLDLAELCDVAEAEQVDAITLVGDAFARPMLHELDAHPGRNLDCVSIIASSGAMFSGEVKVGLHGHLPNAVIVDLIAATEGVMGMSLSFASAPAETARFTPGPGVIVVSEDGRILEPGSDEVGMVALPSGHGQGYFKDAAKTATTYREIGGRHYTVPGDFASIAADGSITLLGRGSQCINTAGEKVFPEEVEEAIKAHPGVEDCLVFGIADERFGQRVVGVVGFTDPAHAVAPDELLAALRDQIASYKHPRQIVTVPLVPRTAVGKPDYPEAKRLFDAAASET